MRTTIPATESPDSINLGWIAGFLEGEGHFRRNGRTELVEASQKEKEPIDRLIKFLGGSLSVNRNMWRWRVSGSRARGVMLTMFGLMSPKRQKEIKTALSQVGVPETRAAHNR